MTGLLILSFPQYYVVAPMYQSQVDHVALLMYQPEFNIFYFYKFISNLLFFHSHSFVWYW